MTFNDLLEKNIKMRLAKELEKKMNDDCLAGYIWTLEHNQENSWHYHFIVFLSIDYEDTFLRDLIGNLWISSVKRQANYYIDDSKGLRSIGTGLVKSGDQHDYNYS